MPAAPIQPPLQGAPATNPGFPPSSSPTLLGNIMSTLNSKGLTKLQKIPIDPPRSQANKYFSFQIFVDGVPRVPFIFPINPEEYELDKVVRVRAINTRGTPYIDDFGVGVPMITISGTTGWRQRIAVTKPDTSKGSKQLNDPKSLRAVPRRGADGYDFYQELHYAVFEKFYSLRQDYRRIGKDPNNVVLRFYNNVDLESYEVFPKLKIKRSKNRPLLYAFEISMIVQRDMQSNLPVAIDDALSNALMNPDTRTLLGQYQMLVLRAKLAQIAEVNNAIKSVPILGPLLLGMLALVDLANQGLGIINRGETVVSDVIKGVAAVIVGVALAGAAVLLLVQNAQQVLNNLTAPLIQALAEAIGTFTDIACTLSSILGPNGWQSFLPDLSSLDGASSCSSTAGGGAASPYVTADNTFLSFGSDGATTTPSAVLSVPTSTQNLIDSINNTDFATAPPLPDPIQTLTTIVNTVTPGSFSNLAPSQINPATPSKAITVDSVVEQPIVSGQTIQELASKYLGDPTQWKQLVTLNNLRYPYISDDPLDQVGFPITTVNLDVPALAGATSVIISEVNLQAGMILVFTNGVDEDVATIDKVVGTTIVLAEPLQFGYPTTAEVNVYNDPTTVSTKVLTSSDKILVPATVPANVGQMTDPFGSDLDIDEDGILIFESGDLAVVSGSGNLVKAARCRYRTIPGELQESDVYGNPALVLIGSKGTPAGAAALAAATRDGIAQDPRISAVENLSAQLFEDVLFTSADLVLINGRTITAGELNLTS